MKELHFITRYDISDFCVGTIAEDKATIIFSEKDIIVRVSRIYCTSEIEQIAINKVNLELNIWEKVEGELNLDDFIMDNKQLLFLQEVEEIKELNKKQEFIPNKFIPKQIVVIDNKEVFYEDLDKWFKVFILNNLNNRLFKKMIEGISNNFYIKRNIDMFALL